MSDEASGDGETRGGYGQSRDVGWTEDDGADDGANDGADDGEPSDGDREDQDSATGAPVPEPPQPEAEDEDEEEDGSDGAESPPQRPR